jgi:hypothetical protein
MSGCFSRHAFRPPVWFAAKEATGTGGIGQSATAGLGRLRSLRNAAVQPKGGELAVSIGPEVAIAIGRSSIGAAGRHDLCRTELGIAAIERKFQIGSPERPRVRLSGRGP